MTTNRVEHIYNLIVFAVRTARREARIPDLDAIISGLHDELHRDIRLGRFSEREACEIRQAIEVAQAQARRDWAVI